MTKLDKGTVLDKFIEAYTDANGTAPSIEAKGGWYSVNGDKNVRLAQLEEITNELSTLSTQTSRSKKQATSEVKKPELSANKPSKKKPVTTFSVRDFYTQQIIDSNRGAKAPR